MGMSGIGLWELLVILVIVLLLFGTKRLRSIGTDLGNAVKGFRNSLHNEEPSDTNANESESHLIDHNQDSTRETEDVAQKNPADSDFRVKPGNGIK